MKTKENCAEAIKKEGNGDLANVVRSLSFPKGIPQCCGKEMYPCGGVIGKRDDDINGDIEHQWRCGNCGNETTDVLG